MTCDNYFYFRRQALILFGVLVLLSHLAWAQPDLSGTYDVGTLTPLQRPEAYGDQLYLTDEEAAILEKQVGERMASAKQGERPAASGTSFRRPRRWLQRVLD